MICITKLILWNTFSYRYLTLLIPLFQFHGALQSLRIYVYQPHALTLVTDADNHKRAYFIYVKTIFGVLPPPPLPRFRDSINILFLCSSNLSDIIHRTTSEKYAHICYFKVLVCQQFLFILLFLYTNGYLDLSNRHFFSIATFARNIFFPRFFEVYRCFTFIVSLCTP